MAGTNIDKMSQFIFKKIRTINNSINRGQELSPEQKKYLIKIVNYFKMHPLVQRKIKEKINSLPVGRADLSKPVSRVFNFITKKLKTLKTLKTLKNKRHSFKRGTVKQDKLVKYMNYVEKYLTDAQIDEQIIKATTYLDENTKKQKLPTDKILYESVHDFIDDIDYMDDTGIYSGDKLLDNTNNNTMKKTVGGEFKEQCSIHSYNIKEEYLDTLLKIVDSYHDFWGGAGESPIGSDWDKKTILNLKMKTQLKSHLTDTAAKYISTIHQANAYNIYKSGDKTINLERIGKLAQLQLRIIGLPDTTPKGAESFERSIKSITTSFFNKIIDNPPDKKYIDISDIEVSSAYNVICIDEPKKYNNGIDVKNPNRNGYLNIIQDIFQYPPIDGERTETSDTRTLTHDIFYICDAGSGPFGILGNFDGSRLKQIITQCTIGDSAMTEKIVRGDTSLPESERTSYEFIKNPVDSEIFISDSNLFTQGNGYKILYNNEGFNLNDPYGISLGIYIPTGEEFTEFKYKFGYNTILGTAFKQGPSASLLSGYFFKASNRILPTEFSNNVKEAINRSIRTKKRASLLLTQPNGTDLSDIPGISPGLFLDIKRGGDRDQVMTAYYIKQRQPDRYIIFCTGDLLCATIAVKLGLPTILQLKSGKIRYWKENSEHNNNNRNAAAQGLLLLGRQNNPLSSSPNNNKNINININSTRGGGEEGDEGDSVSYVDIIHFIQNIAAHSAFSLRSNISRGVNYADLDTTVQSIQNLINKYYEPWVDFKKSIATSEYQIGIYKYVCNLFFNMTIPSTIKITMFALLHDVINNNTTSANISNIYKIIPEDKWHTFDSYCSTYNNLLNSPFNEKTINMYGKLILYLKGFVDSFEDVTTSTKYSRPYATPKKIANNSGRQRRELAATRRRRNRKNRNATRRRMVVLESINENSTP
jgi:hypothetical protein